MIKKIDKQTLDNLCAEAKQADRQRKNLNYHSNFNDPINRMLNAVEPGSYVQPHKHENPDKREVFIILRGKMAVVFFDDDGNITENLILDNKENYGVEIPPAVWHTIIALERGTVVYEVKDGPYSPSDDKNFASWAPKEDEKESADYIRHILKSLKITL
ncbi:WbuC family cupin fold metalloprotein [uncultured Draconibacterium sp.]|uniref:WbuC family cupin fold metalloprotein n=1 Tax=uncultured Draconibacterium sp. TaxID=1573823 RepID=UPI0029C63A50|nr:WbuC family cupin fold metalloprotein [uncultured Draconibacterium sp.]